VIAFPFPQVATCTNFDGSYTCTCNRGWIGNGFACSNIDECSNAAACLPTVCVSSTHQAFPSTQKDFNLNSPLLSLTHFLLSLSVKTHRAVSIACARRASSSTCLSVSTSTNAPQERTTAGPAARASIASAHSAAAFPDSRAVPA
jgi:hypothetical protein